MWSEVPLAKSETSLGLHSTASETPTKLFHCHLFMPENDWKGLNYLVHDCISYIGRETQRDRERKGPFFPYITTSAQRRLSPFFASHSSESISRRKGEKKKE